MQMIENSTTKKEIHLTTSDNWKIALYKYSNRKATKKHPVFLLHGIASCHHTWDIGIDKFSFAYYLVDQGYDVYSIDLRGRPNSDGPETGRGQNWSVDDYLLCDLPRAVEYILEDSGAKQLHWVGHSLGGVLGYFYQVRHKSHQLKSMITFASSLTYTFSTINHFRTWLDYLAVFQNYPIRTWWMSMLPFADYDLPWNRFLWNPENLEPEVKRAIFTRVMSRIGVFEWNQVKTISSAEGMPRVSTANLYHSINDRRIDTPVLSLAADDDWVCPLDGVEWTIKNLKPEAKLVVFGKHYGHAVSYGHMDIVLGIHAVKEVWPRALEWLNDKDSK